MKKKIRLIAFYLPQYHPIPENDEWWGNGFTEWTNVVKAKKLFPDHYQPHIPADLGFYDLRLPEARIAQAELAKEYGIEGFCYYHYWFNGKRLLERPFNEVLKTGKPKLPFCLAWANETWSRRWLGEERDILREQTYSTEDDYNHIYWLIEAFSDSRYICVSGRPLFLVYRPRHLPDPKKTTDIFRNECIKSGLPEPFLLGIDAHCPNFDCRKIGFDGTVKFEPQLGFLPDYINEDIKFSKLKRNIKMGVLNPRLKIYDYVYARSIMIRRKPKFSYYPSIFVGWDNTPRRGNNGIIMTDATPDNFANGLADIIQSVLTKPNYENLVFINAWNEWAEGNHLEPDLKWGLAYLKATYEIIINVTP